MFDMSNITACGWGTYADASQPCLMLLQFDYKTECQNTLPKFNIAPEKLPSQ